MDKRIVIGADFAGYELKELVKKHLEETGYEVTDLGMTDPAQPLPYHLAGFRVGQAIHLHQFTRGLIFCGSGMGIHIAAGKFSGVYAAVCESVESARRSRVANDCNLLAIGAFYTSPEQACQMADVFLTTQFGQGESEDFVRDHRKWLNEMELFSYE